MVVNGMDRTGDFVNALKAARKAERVLDSKNSNIKLSNLLLRSRRSTQFIQKAKEIVSSASKLKEFLLRHRNAYINASQVAGLPSQSMTDYERDKIDEEAQNIIKKCNEAIATMQQNLHSSESSEQVNTHRQLVLQSIQNYVRSICKIYSEQRAIRVKLIVDKKRISRLHDPESLKKSVRRQEQSAEQMERGDEGEQPPKISIPTRYAYDDSDEEITEEDAATLEQENALLFNDMNSMVDEVKAIQGKVVEIARLQEIFSEQVLQQEGDIEMIAEKVVTTTENIKDGNEEVREAIKNNAGFRVWILFFLLMCSFSLLFLEWYS